MYYDLLFGGGIISIEVIKNMKIIAFYGSFIIIYGTLLSEFLSG